MISKSVNNIVAFRLSTKRSAILRFFWGVADSASSAYQTHPCGTAITENGPLLARVLIRSINHVINHPMPPATCLVQFLLPASQPASQRSQYPTRPVKSPLENRFPRGKWNSSFWHPAWPPPVPAQCKIPRRGPLYIICMLVWYLGLGSCTVLLK